MMKRFELLFLVLQVPLDFLLLLLAGITAYFLRFTPLVISLRPVTFGLSFPHYFLIISFVALFWVLLFAFSGLYEPDPNRRLAADIRRIFFACSAGLAGVALYLLFTQSQFDSRFLVVIGWALSLLYVSLGRFFMRLVRRICYYFGFGKRYIAIVGNGKLAVQLTDAIKERKNLGYVVAGIFGTWAEAKKALEGMSIIDEIIFTDPRHHEQDAIDAITYATERQIVFKYSADLFATFSTNMAVHPMAGIPIVEIRRTPLEGWGRVVKRVADIFGSLFLLILTFPITFFVSVIILLETGRPFIYKNERVGSKNKNFFAFKFRTMYQKDCTGPQFGESGRVAMEKEQALIAERNTKNGPVYKIANDPRVTTFGRFLRWSSIDELPQLLNVLFGSMSLVGPRPHQPREVSQYENHHKKVFAIKPGITGMAQISGRSDLSFDDEVRLDVFYIEHWSLWLDFIICLKTPFVLFRKRKAL